MTILSTSYRSVSDYKKGMEIWTQCSPSYVVSELNKKWKAMTSKENYHRPFFLAQKYLEALWKKWNVQYDTIHNNMRWSYWTSGTGYWHLCVFFQHEMVPEYKETAQAAEHTDSLSIQSKAVTSLSAWYQVKITEIRKLNLKEVRNGPCARRYKPENYIIRKWSCRIK